MNTSAEDSNFKIKLKDKVGLNKQLFQSDRGMQNQRKPILGKSSGFGKKPIKGLGLKGISSFKTTDARSPMNGGQKSARKKYHQPPIKAGSKGTFSKK